MDQGSPEWNEHEASERPSTRSARPSFAIGHRLPFPSRLRVRVGRRSRAGKAGGMKVMQRRILLALVAVLCAAIGVQGTSPSTTRSRDETARRERDRDPRADPPPTQGRGSPAMNKLTNLTIAAANPTLTSRVSPNLRSRMRVPHQLRRLCGRYHLRMVRDRDRTSRPSPDSIPAPGPFSKSLSHQKGPFAEVKFSRPP